MIRVAARLKQAFTSFKNPINDYDLTNMMGLIKSPEASFTFMEKMSFFSPGNLYNSFDQFTRELLFAIANDHKLGVPVAIILLSFAFKGIFFYPSIKGQISSLKMLEIKPQFERYKQRMQIAQRAKNRALMKEAQNQFEETKRKHGIQNFWGVVNILQIPFLFSWFFSIRYITTMPQMFPQIMDSFLWIDDICAYDPYFIFPLLSATLSSYSITLSPAMRNPMFPMIEPILKYMKYFPFLTLPITAFFPAALNIYWCTLSFSQAMVMVSVNNLKLRKLAGFKTVEKVSQISKAVFIENKNEGKQDLSVKTKMEASGIEQQKQRIVVKQQIEIVANKVKKNKKKA